MSDRNGGGRLYAGYVVNATALDMLLEYAQGQRKHEGMCFTAEDEEHLERQIPFDGVRTCPVCEAVFEVQQAMRAADAKYDEHMQEVRGRFFLSCEG